MVAMELSALHRASRARGSQPRWTPMPGREAGDDPAQVIDALLLGDDHASGIPVMLVGKEMGEPEDPESGGEARGRPQEAEQSGALDRRRGASGEGGGARGRIRHRRLIPRGPWPQAGRRRRALGPTSSERAGTEVVLPARKELLHSLCTPSQQGPCPDPMGRHATRWQPVPRGRPASSVPQTKQLRLALAETGADLSCSASLARTARWSNHPCRTHCRGYRRDRAAVNLQALR